MVKVVDYVRLSTAIRWEPGFGWYWGSTTVPKLGKAGNLPQMVLKQHRFGAFSVGVSVWGPDWGRGWWLGSRVEAGLRLMPHKAGNASFWASMVLK